MVRQYPHQLVATPFNDSSLNEDTGNWVAGSLRPPVVTKCRAESSDGNGFINSAGGTRIDYSCVVYLPPNVDRLKEGTPVEVFDGSELIFKDTVKRFWRGELNARIWL